MCIQRSPVVVDKRMEERKGYSQLELLFKRKVMSLLF